MESGCCVVCESNTYHRLPTSATITNPHGHWLCGFSLFSGKSTVKGKCSTFVQVGAKKYGDQSKKGAVLRIKRNGSSSFRFILQQKARCFLGCRLRPPGHFLSRANRLLARVLACHGRFGPVMFGYPRPPQSAVWQKYAADCAG